MPAHTLYLRRTRPRRAFAWFFSAVQAGFAVWLAWAALAATAPPAACTGQGCAQGETARAAFTALAVLAIWTLSDVILASWYVVYRAVTRRP